MTKVALDELGESTGAVADPVLFCGVDLAKGQRLAVRDEHRVVAEPAITARRPGEGPFNLAAEELRPTVGPGEREDRDETRDTVLFAEFPVNAFHRDPEVFGGTGPARGINPRRAAERRDDEPGIVGERRQPTGLCRSLRLQGRV